MAFDDFERRDGEWRIAHMRLYLVLESSCSAVMSTASGAIRELTRGDELASYPGLHPTQDLIVFSTDGLSDFHGRLDNHSSNLFAVRLDGSELTQVTSFPAGGSRAAQPTWSPDGKLIVFTLATGPNNDTAHIATIEADGTNLTDLAAPGTHNRL